MARDAIHELYGNIRRRMESQAEAAQEAYNAFEFGRKIMVPPTSGFFFTVHKDQAVMARRIFVLPEDGGELKTAFFCVAFAEKSTRITEAFAYVGKNEYFGFLPESFIDEQIDDDERSAPRNLM
jgi:hypothetical protein